MVSRGRLAAGAEGNSRKTSLLYRPSAAMTVGYQYRKEQLAVATAGKDSLVTRRLGWAGRSAMVCLGRFSRVKPSRGVVLSSTRQKPMHQQRCEVRWSGCAAEQSSAVCLYACLMLRPHVPGPRGNWLWTTMDDADEDEASRPSGCAPLSITRAKLLHLLRAWRIREDSSRADAVGNNIETHAYKKP